MTDKRLADIEWRLDNLYFIKDKWGNRVKFVRNESQLRLWRNLHTLNLILKDRQRGFSTLIAMIILDDCLFNSDQSCAIIDLTLDDAKKKLAKIKYAYDNLPDWLKKGRKLITDNKELLEWDNGSSVAVGTSHRGGTAQILHISEFGPIAARRPDRAREIRTGALNTVAPGNYVFIESTAEGKGGEFFDYVKEARHKSDSELTDLDFKLHFFGWWMGEENVLEGVPVTITTEHQEYFDKIEAENNIKLTMAQKSWYVKKSAQQGDDMVREYPGTIDEAFESSVQGAYYAKQFVKLRKNKQITKVPYDEALPVITAWDLGMNDEMAVWFLQMAGREWHAIDYESTTGEGFPYWAQLLKDKGYFYTQHNMPHDAAVRELGTGVSRITTAENLGIQPIQRVPRAKGPEEIIRDIGITRTFIVRCWFDEVKCKKGLDALEAYTKRWDEKNAVFLNTPLHNFASNPADAFRTMAVADNLYGVPVLNLSDNDYDYAQTRY